MNISLLVVFIGGLVLSVFCLVWALFFRKESKKVPLLLSCTGAFMAAIAIFVNTLA